MSLPSSERLPSDINDLPPARQRHIRRQPQSASLAERQILLESLVKTTAPTPAFFARAILGALAVGTALYLNNLAVLIVAIVILPFQAPLFGLALFPMTLNLKHTAKCFVSQLMLMIVTAGAGVISGMITVFHNPDRLGLYRFSALYWLDVTIVIVCTLLSVLILLRQGKTSPGLGVLLSYTLLIPLAVFGFGVSNGMPQLWPGALLVGMAHFGLALVISVITFGILGFQPKKALGWLVTITILMITLAIVSFSLNLTLGSAPAAAPTTPTPTRLVIATDEPASQDDSTTTFTPTATLVPPTATLVPPTATLFPPTSTLTSTAMPSNTPSPTPEPTVFWGVIVSESGAVIRSEPDFSAEIISYANNGDQIEITGESIIQGGSNWFPVLTRDEQTGWLLGSLVHTQTPSPVNTD